MKVYQVRIEAGKKPVVIGWFPDLDEARKSMLYQWVHDSKNDMCFLFDDRVMYYKAKWGENVLGYYQGPGYYENGKLIIPKDKISKGVISYISYPFQFILKQEKEVEPILLEKFVFPQHYDVKGDWPDETVVSLPIWQELNLKR